MNKFSNSSAERLAQAHPKLQSILTEALQYKDFTIAVGFRDKAAQDAAYAGGFSKLKWPASKHNKQPSLAVDIFPYWKEFGPILGTEAQLAKIMQVFSCTKAQANQFVYNELYALAQLIKGVALKQGTAITWGGDWDNDGNIFDQRFNDLGHFELKGAGGDGE